MKAQLAFGLLLVLISSISLRSHMEVAMTVQFQHASRDNLTQESNKFILEFNGITIKEWIPTDYEIHKESFRFSAREGINRVSFIGTGTSDGMGQTIDNVKIFKANRGEYSIAVNGGFEEGHPLRNGWKIFPNGHVPGWSSTDDEMEVGWGGIYNSRWPADTHVCELDANHNSNVFQEA